ncbi:MAG TPA: DUF192 domain-containing protein [Candidatus Methylomirabilis sp.]|nr:DUF192 domain-containing protein [Candidatus Methylomirabilis sp.]
MPSTERNIIPAVCLALGGLAIAAAITTSVFSSAIVTVGFTTAASPQPELPTREITVNDHRVTVEVADDEDEQERGLSFRSGMDRDRGMLFVYPNASRQRFWMYGMHFPLDIIFIRDGRVISIAAGVPAPMSGVPAVVISADYADTVLELNAGVAKELGIVAGSDVLQE